MSKHFENGDKSENIEKVEKVEKTEKPEGKEKTSIADKIKSFFSPKEKSEKGKEKEKEKDSNGDAALKKIEDEKKAFNDRLKVSPEVLKKNAEKMKEQQKKGDSGSDSSDKQHGEGGERTRYSDRFERDDR